MADFSKLSAAVDYVATKIADDQAKLDACTASDAALQAQVDALTIADQDLQVTIDDLTAKLPAPPAPVEPPAA